MEQRTVMVIGAGASGMMAAITAAEHGAKVTLLEAMERPGKKLLLTGNGRCNLTNLEKTLPDAYYGTGAPLAKRLIPQFDAESVCRFLEERGLLTNEKNGYVYPYTAQSLSVLEVLTAELRRLKVKIKLSEKIEKLWYENGIWNAAAASWCYQSDAVILACGSKAAPQTGSDGSGYTLAKSLGHTVKKVVPALTPVTCGEILPFTENRPHSEQAQIRKRPFPVSLAGVRCRARVSLWKSPARKSVNSGISDNSSTGHDVLLGSETGELQWTKYGISGIVVFQLSRFVSNGGEKEKLYVTLDLLPEFGEEMLEKMIADRASKLASEKLPVLLSGILNQKLIPVLLECAGDCLGSQKNGNAKISCASLTQKQIRVLVHLMKHFALTVTGTKSFDTAQVCAGGVDAAEVSETLESRRHAGLYFTGELLDVDGPCGGYNLQWAWTSGYVAGRAAALGQKEQRNYENQSQ